MFWHLSWSPLGHLVQPWWFSLLLAARYNILGAVQLVALVAFSFVLSATDDRVSVPTLAVELEYEYSDLLSRWDKSS